MNRPDVAVVVPVYRGFPETRRCLESVLASDLPENVIVVVVDDASPDIDVSNYCEQLQESGRITLLRNEKNMGFVASVNKAMTFSDARDVVLLNSDCEVPRRWVQRLARCAYENPQTGTVTPFSNNATICSYPVLGQENDLPGGLSLTELDELFAEANAEQSCEIPTAVGSCMYVRRDCIDVVGGFDEKRFGMGYGEENDFCMRATLSGWTHRICADLFVYHQGGVSFGDTKRERMKNADTTIGALYPQYSLIVDDFLSRDPVRLFRDAVDTALLQKYADRGVLLLDGLRAYRDQLLRNMRDKHAHIEQLQTQLEQTSELLGLARAEFGRVDSALAEVQQLADNKQQQIEELGRRYDTMVHEKNATIIAHEVKLEELAHSLVDTQSKLNAAEEAVRNMINSRSWRYTRWLRWLSEKLSR